MTGQDRAALVAGSVVRPMPSGHLHAIEWVDADGAWVGRDALVFRCGKEARRSLVTQDFPPGARRCPVCFPPAQGG